MKKITSFALVALAIVGFSGCFRHTFTSGDGGSIEKYDRWHHHFIAGLINGSDTVHVEQLCPSTTNFTVYERQSFFNGLVGAVTLGIYTPTAVTVNCGAATK